MFKSLDEITTTSTKKTQLSHAISRHDIFKLVQEKANLNDHDMLSTFNCGIGMIIVVQNKYKDNVINDCNKLNYRTYEIGSITRGSRSKVIYE